MADIPTDVSHAEVARLARTIFRGPSAGVERPVRLAVLSAAASGRLEELVSEAAAVWSPRWERFLFAELMRQGYHDIVCRSLTHQRIEVQRAALHAIELRGDVRAVPWLRLVPDENLRQRAQRLVGDLEARVPRPPASGGPGSVKATACS
jgi:hypothetical protein